MILKRFMSNRIVFKKVLRLKDTFDTYKQFLTIDKQNKVIFDFEEATFVYANFTALFGALIDGCDKFEIILSKDEKVKSVLSKNNFFPNFVKNIKKLKDKSNSVVNYENFGLEDIEKQDRFSEKLLLENLLEKKGVTNLSQKVLKEVSKSILELFSNARDHSKSQKGIYIAGQFGVRIEDTVQITKDGCISLTKSGKDYIVIQ